MSAASFILKFLLPAAIISALFIGLRAAAVLTPFVYQMIAYALLILGFVLGLLVTMGGDEKPFLKPGMVMMVTGFVMLVVNLP